MHTVLIPLDFSKSSMNAAEYAISMFRNRPTKFILASVVTYRQPIGGIGALRHKIDKGSQRDLNKAFDKLSKSDHFPGHVFEKVLIHEEPVDGIILLAREYDVNSILMGTTGASGLKEKLMGSVAAGVIKKSLRPVITIPMNTKFRALSKIVLATDFKAVKDYKAYEYLITILKNSTSELIVLHVSKESKSATMRKSLTGGEFDQLIGKTRHRYDFIQDEDPVAAIVKYIDDEKVDLLVMLNHKNPSIDSLFKASSVEKISMHIKAPLLTLAES